MKRVFENKVEYKGKIPKLAVSANVIGKVQCMAKAVDGKSFTMVGEMTCDHKAKEYMLDDIYCVKQRSGVYAINIDKDDFSKDFESNHAFEKQDATLSYACAVIYKNTEESIDKISSTELTVFNDGIAKEYPAFFYVLMNKKGDISVGIIDNDNNITISDMEFTINYSCCTYEKTVTEITNEAKSLVSNILYTAGYNAVGRSDYTSNNYYGGYSIYEYPYNSSNSTAAYSTPKKKKYTPAQINKDNPSIKDLV